MLPSEPTTPRCPLTPQAGSPSSERRALVAEALGAAVGVVEVGTQGHVLLTQLTTLAKDRLEAVGGAGQIAGTNPTGSARRATFL